ncbi:preprotein translocase subunit YajC [Candidatus Finniella inopinata]|uniref:Sec translocon accessory complex subunit YajC n=1 Tax=Candidatus Finniella inopinata TaxID=1696036 RepID=A0A4Q7DFK5_9PROT|nr:preprotein translocase subunit YajC [Candidatus Finniella inopinata]RZI45503.1 preprotein translocase subunit YajC [Candidatus Finniella inopinata]
MFLITAAHADGAPVSSGAGFDIMSFLPIILIFGVFYFLILRPQQAKAKKHQQTLTALRRGDRVVTNGGIIGTVTKLVSDNEIQLEIDDNVKVRFMRAMITDVLSKNEPVASEPVVKAKASKKSKE